MRSKYTTKLTEKEILKIFLKAFPEYKNEDWEIEIKPTSIGTYKLKTKNENITPTPFKPFLEVEFTDLFAWVWGSYEQSIKINKIWRDYLVKKLDLGEIHWLRMRNKELMYNRTPYENKKSTQKQLYKINKELEENREKIRELKAKSNTDNNDVADL